MFDFIFILYIPSLQGEVEIGNPNQGDFYFVYSGLLFLQVQVVLMNILEMEAIHYFHGQINFMFHMPQMPISRGLVCSINTPHVSLFQVL
jgi:hypothetical protein